ncbi:protein TIC 40, chloroplastic [Olea europaea var. sylvestris]|uniref:protein TIC 40, chloroplastic n=1 Tax=Olea europaea var. sylvestris TaxID=158386 RepID=UPI000C1CD343|nr:protein TIC 40, chloroplastic [Olea europaea var. sylvestris]
MFFMFLVVLATSRSKRFDVLLFITAILQCLFLYCCSSFSSDPHAALEKVRRDSFASTTTSKSQETSSVGVNPQISMPPPSSQVGSPLFWIGVGVGLSALFSWVATYLKKYAMQQAFKTLMGQMNTQNNQFSNAAFSPGSPFPFPQPTNPTSDATSTSTSAASQSVTVDVPATKVEDPPSADVKETVEPEKEPKKYAFVDVSPEETFQKNAFENYKESIQTDAPKDPEPFQQVSENGSAANRGTSFSEGPSTKETNPLLSVEALEKMMEDPTVQKMVYPYLPEEMRNPTTFKWMLQNPQYRRQLQDMLNNMGGSPEWDNRMMDSLKNFDLSSPDIKQQFDQIGLTPEEVISKIMANPEVAMAFQNPRVQAAIMDCSQNPLSIAKYQNDKEVMDVFNKISELFPGATGS